MKRIIGYNGKSIISATDEDIRGIVSKGTQKDIISLFVLLKIASHHRKTSTDLEDLVEVILISAGWEVHIKDNLQKELSPCYIHDALNKLAVHEVPFSHESNIYLEKNELFDKKGKVRKKEQTLKLLKKRIGEKEIETDFLEDCVRLPVVAIFKEEHLSLLHQVGGRILRSGNREFQWYFSEKEMEEEAREMLEDGDEWRAAVADENTSLALDDWIEEVIRIDGVAQTLPTYDGKLREATLPSGETLYYVRI